MSPLVWYLLWYGFWFQSPDPDSRQTRKFQSED